MYTREHKYICMFTDIHNRVPGKYGWKKDTYHEMVKVLFLLQLKGGLVFKYFLSP